MKVVLSSIEYETISRDFKNMQIEGDATRKNLIRIISQYGQSILEDPDKLKNLLLDLNQGLEKKEVNIIGNSLDDKVPFDLLKSKDLIPYEISSERSIQRLQNSYGVTEDLARWTVNTWAIALHVITEGGNNPIKSHPATFPVPPPQHQVIITPSVTSPIPNVKIFPKVVSHKNVNKKSDKTGYIALGLFIISIFLMNSGNTDMNILGVFALMTSMGLGVYAIGKSINWH